MTTHAACLSESTHKVVFHFMPKHYSWLNQIEIRFSILVRKLLRMASLCSTAGLKATIRWPEGYDRRFHYLLQWHDGQAVQVDLPRESFESLKNSRDIHARKY